jgi:hypothetical protein
MTDEQESVAPVEAEAPIEQEQGTDETVNLQESPQVEAEAPVVEAEPEDDFEEFDWNGKQIKAPKGLKDGVLMHADYTKKTQEVATRRKELEAYEQQVLQQAKASDEELNARAALVHIDSQLKQYENVDWDRWEQEDPIAAQQGWRRFQSMKEQKAVTAQELTAKQHERTEQAKRADATRLQETEAYARKLPGWTPQVGKEIADYAVSKGIDMDTLQANITPQFYDILFEARIGRAALQKQASAPKTPPQIAKPLSVVGAKTNAPVAKSLADADMEEYVALRKKQNARGR